MGLRNPICLLGSHISLQHFAKIEKRRAWCPSKKERAWAEQMQNKEKINRKEVKIQYEMEHKDDEEELRAQRRESEWEPSNLIYRSDTPLCLHPFDYDDDLNKQLIFISINNSDTWATEGETAGFPIILT